LSAAMTVLKDSRMSKVLESGAILLSSFCCHFDVEFVRCDDGAERQQNV
jgi:hypothetical protein